MLIKELIDIPERVQRGDFVLNLASGVVDADRTLADYVVTPQLARCFDDALGFIKSAVDGSQNRSKGAYLHGSFGSGKSHFMAVLHLLLQGHPGARSIPELAATIEKHDRWLRDQRCLLVPYHMINETSLEAGVLGGYARHIKTLHPDAPTPGFYLSGRLFHDARELRQHMGDEKFFGALNQAAQHTDSGDDWGDLASGWDAVSFEAVLDSRSGAEEEQRLVGDLVGSLFTSYTDLANRNQSNAYLDFDSGLAVLCRHAKALGYNAVILFLDELILWLASRLADRAFITSEIQKVVKLVESNQPRALPLVSFIARQRDLRDFVGDQFSGSEQEILSDSLKYWEGRFHTITLEDRNLPVIAEKRLLKPKSAEAKAQLQEAFASTERGNIRAEMFDVLLTSQGDRQMFRRVYPFSPALIQALVALSSALQRERTALKVMLLLLVGQREQLQLGQIIPVGDLYDVIASEAEPFSEQMRMYFDNARQLFERKLIPLLEREHGLIYQELAERPADDAQRQAVVNDERLLKTLLLAALTPEVECFKQLTGTKLAALNHGSIKSPIPGREAQLVLQKCRRWAGQVGEIKINDDSDNATIAVQLSGVDTESILEQARIHDSPGNRRSLLKELVFEAFAISAQGQGQIWQEHELIWRGSRRRVEVVFENIRSIKDDGVFEPREGHWKFVIDFPFDEETGRSPHDDEARIEDYLNGGKHSRSVCWLPYFFSRDTQLNLGKLVRLEYILKSDERFAGFTQHLSPQDRLQARTLLDNQRSSLRQQIRNSLDGAYGISEAPAGSLDQSTTLQTQILSLQPGFTPQLPVGATMQAAFEQLISQALASQFPAHPEFEAEVRMGDLEKVLTELRKAIHAKNGRIGVADRQLRILLQRIAQPLELGTMYENHFVFSPDWPRHFQRELNKEPGDISVGRLRALIDLPKPRGLPDPIQNLLIMLFAEHDQYAFTLSGAPYAPALRDLPDELKLLRQNLPDSAHWQPAVDLLAALTGDTVSPLLNASNLALFNQTVRKLVNEHRPHCRELKVELSKRQQALHITPNNNRLANASLAAELLEQLQHQTDDTGLVTALAGVEPPTSATALGRSIRSARELMEILREANWDLLALAQHKPELAQPGQTIRQTLLQALQADELAVGIGTAIKQAEREVTALLAGMQVKPDPAPPEKQPELKQRRVVAQKSYRGLDKTGLNTALQELQRELQAGDARTVDLSWEIVAGENVDGENNE